MRTEEAHVAEAGDVWLYVRRHGDELELQATLPGSELRIYLTVTVEALEQLAARARELS